MKAVKAYFDGHAFVPEKPVKAKKNQQVLIILDDVREEHSRDVVRKANKALCGIAKGTGQSSEAFMARKEADKGFSLWKQ